MSIQTSRCDRLSSMIRIGAAVGALSLAAISTVHAAALDRIRETGQIKFGYFADVRPVVERDGTLIMVDDARMPLKPGEKPMMKKVRFRTLGCYPLTGAIESNATTLPEIIEEMLLARNSERQGRVIDHDEAGSMEQKKREGYF